VIRPVFIWHKIVFSFGALSVRLWLYKAESFMINCVIIKFSDVSLSRRLLIAIPLFFVA
jgi:hypothetical protein